LKGVLEKLRLKIEFSYFPGVGVDIALVNTGKYLPGLDLGIKYSLLFRINLGKGKKLLLQKSSSACACPNHEMTK